MQAGELAFTPRVGGEAVCVSVPDGQAVEGITALELGELGSGTLRAMLRLPADDPDGATAEFWIDGGDLPEGSLQPFWNGSARITEIGSDGATGKLIFNALAGVNDPALKGPESPAATPVASEWPSTISGVLGWTCQPW